MDTISLLMQILLWPLCLGIVGLILLQGGAGDLSSAFGGGGMLDSTLGVGASKKMAKVTGWMAGIFFLFVLFLAVPHKGGFGSVNAPTGTAVPATTGDPAAAVPATVHGEKPEVTVEPMTSVKAPATVPAASAPVIQGSAAAPSVSAPTLVTPTVENPTVKAPAVPAVVVPAAPAVAVPVVAAPAVEAPKPVEAAPVVPVAAPAK